MRRWLLVLLLAQPALAYYPMDMWQAERAAARGSYTEAVTLYRQALKERPESAEAHFNLAHCLYRLERYAEAEPLFKKAQELAQPGPLKGQAAYNLGNALFRQKKLKESLEAYKVALRWNELDDDARYNIQVVLDLLKDKNKDKNQDKNKDKDKDKKDPKKKPDPKKDKQPPKQDKGKEKDKNQGKDKGQGSPTPTPAPRSSPTPQPGGASPTPSPSPSDQDEAERLLQFFQNREKQAQKRRFNGRPAAPSGDFDW